MNILITGASGFLGRFLSNVLENQDHQLTKISSKNCDLTEASSLHQFNSIQFDQIFHLAAWTQAGDFCLKHPGEQWIINQKINTNTLSWWQTYQPQAKLIAIGTSCSYAPNSQLKETEYLEGLPIDSLFTYGMTKRMLYVGLKALNKQYGLNYLYLVPSTLYGCNYHTDGRQMHFIFDLIRKILKAKELGTPVTLWGDGYQKRELVFVDDFVNIMLTLNSTINNEIVNIGAGEEYSIRDFAQLICDIVGYEFKNIQFDTSKYVGARSKCLNTEKLQALLPRQAKTPLLEGLQKTISWFETHIPIATA